MDNVFVYLVHLPLSVKEFVVPCADGCFTVYINCNLDSFSMRKAYEHALTHIKNGDFDRFNDSVQQIECEAHSI